jgi:3-mercaptopyruvate sulfurtransferase SseA
MGVKMTEYVDVLNRAREQMVKARRELTAVLAKPYDKRTTPQARITFTEVQNTIDQIDKAIADERKPEPNAANSPAPG